MFGAQRRADSAARAARCGQPGRHSQATCFHPLADSISIIHIAAAEIEIEIEHHLAAGAYHIRTSVCARDANATSTIAPALNYPRNAKFGEEQKGKETPPTYLRKSCLSMLAQLSRPAESRPSDNESQVESKPLRCCSC